MSNVNVLNRLISIIETTLKFPADKIDIDAHFESLGINSLIMMELIENIDQHFETTLTPALFADVSTVSELADLLEGLMGEAVQHQPAPVAAPAYADPTQDVLGYFSEKYAVDLSNRAFGSVDDMVDALVADHSGDLLQHYGIGSAEEYRAPARALDIAIIGISCRLPDAPDARTFWDNLLNEKNSAREIPNTRWNWQAHFSDSPSPGKTVSKWGALIEDVDCFDAGFFNIPQNEAMAMDPQQRLLLQEAYRAVEDAGMNIRTLAGSNTGVFVGCQYSEYEQHLRKLDNKDMKQGPLFSSSTPSYYLANRLSFAFDFRGPSESINVNCASSAVAINRAYYSLLNGESDIAIAGGVSLNLFEGDYIASSQYGILSPNGSSGVFDNDANGFTRGEGVAVIVLKRLEEAERDSNRIYAVIKSCHQNYRGAARSMSEVKHESFTDVLSECYKKASVDPETVKYVEVDGYATKWADSFEYEGVKNAFSNSGKQNEKRCALGSVKGNIGNVEAASGVTNVIKLALSLHHKKFPATISKKKINTFIDIDSASHPLYIADKAIAFEDIRDGDAPIRAGINSFADSGTNVHILLEEYVASRSAAHVESDAKQLFVLSANDAGRLAAYVEHYIAYLSSAAESDSFRALIFTAQLGREALDERLAIVAASRGELIEKLSLIKQAGMREPLGLESKDIYRGSAKTAEKNALAGLITAEMAHMPLAQSVQTKQWKQIALLWVNGVHMPWEVVWQGKPVRPLSLPGYPFAKDRYWIDVEAVGSDKNYAVVASSAPPEQAAPPRAPAPEAPAPNIEWYFYVPGAGSTVPPGAPALERTEKVELFLKQEVARQLDSPLESIALDKNLIDLGMSSIGIAELILKTDRLLNAHLSPSILFKHPEIGSLSEHLATTYPERIDALVVSQTEPAVHGVASAPVAVDPAPAGAPADILVAVQSKGAREPLFALPGAGGNALSLQQLSHSLGSEQPFYCLEPVGLDGRSAPMASVEEIAEFNIERLRTMPATGPYRLLGYSNGGVVAFEMARKLLERKEKVSSLIMLDTLCPTVRGEHSIEEMAVAVFNHFASSLGVHSDLDVETVRQVPENERSEYLYDFLVKRGVELPKRQFVATFNVATASERACRAYRPSKLTQKVELILLKAVNGYQNVPRDYGWGPFVPGQIRTFEFKADHFSLIEKGPVGDIAKKIVALTGKSGKPTARAEQEVNA